MGFLKRLFIIDKPDGGDTPNDLHGRLTNEGLLKKLSEVFVNYINEESVGQRLIYPMSFNVLMHKNDYESRKETLHLVLPEVISNFYTIIKEKSREYPKYEPAARYWFFQFSPAMVDTLPVDGGSDLVIRQGAPAIAACLFSKNEMMDTGNVSVENDIRVSVSCLNSNVFNTANLNINTLIGVDMISEGVFRFKFDMKLDNDATKIVPVPDDEIPSGYATLKYQKDGKTFKYTMKDTQITLSGSSELNRKRSLFVVESDKVSPSHIVIRYVSDKKFQIAAFGPARLNGVTMKIGENGEPEWKDLANKSRIFINDAVTVHFEMLL